MSRPGTPKRLPNHIDIDDLVNLGVLGLMDAFRKFDPQKRAQFGTFARFRIRGAILDGLRALDWSPRELRYKQRKIEQARHVLTARYRRVPSESEVATELKMKLGEFQQLLGEIKDIEVGTLHDTFAGEERIAQLPDRTDEDPLSQCLRAEIQQGAVDAIEGLPERERLVILLYYREELTMKEIGMQFGVAESRISQIHSSAIRRLRSSLCIFRPNGKPADIRRRPSTGLSSISRRRNQSGN